MRLAVVFLLIPDPTQVVCLVRRFIALGFLIFLLASGCAETKLHTVDDSMMQQQLAPLEDGKTTKQEILLKFGIPSAQFEGERIFTYRLRYNQEEKRFEVAAREVDRRDPRFAQRGWTEYNLVVVFDEKHILQKHSMLRINP
jgi:outer membrane protein assembly factor BamE (lipoprotein component of BamABCDE complex)